MTLSRSNNTVFFDLGNVLIFFNLDKMFEQLARCTHLKLDDLYLGFMKNEDLLKKYETGRLTSYDLYVCLSSKSAHLFSFQQMMEALADMFTPNQELWPLVEKLKNNGSKLVLLSNTNECHFKYAYAHFPVLKLFDKFILSYEVGARKPEPLIFRKALLEAAGQNFYTDDIPAFVEAGRSAGLDAEVFTDVPTLQQHLTARNFL